MPQATSTWCLALGTANRNTQQGYADGQKKQLPLSQVRKTCFLWRKVGQAGWGGSESQNVLFDQQPPEMLCPSYKGGYGQHFTLFNIKYSKENVFLARIS